MSSARSNPYPPGSFEHAAWQRWNQPYFQQPVYAQMFDLESRLRSSLWTLLSLSDRITHQSYSAICTPACWNSKPLSKWSTKPPNTPIPVWLLFLAIAPTKELLRNSSVRTDEVSMSRFPLYVMLYSGGQPIGLDLLVLHPTCPGLVSPPNVRVCSRSDLRAPLQRIGQRGGARSSPMTPLLSNSVHCPRAVQLVR